VTEDEITGVINRMYFRMRSAFHRGENTIEFTEQEMNAWRKPMSRKKESPLLRPNGDGTYSLTASGDRLLRQALLRSAKVLYTLKRPDPSK
jgi:hypothetical protein